MVPEDFDLTPGMEFLQKLGDFLPPADVIKIIQLCYKGSNTQWATSNEELADSMFDFPYPPLAMRLLGYTPMPLSERPTTVTAAAMAVLREPQIID